MAKDRIMRSPYMMGGLIRTWSSVLISTKINVSNWPICNQKIDIFEGFCILTIRPAYDQAQKFYFT